MSSIIVFDADNTLWNTDGVFKNAQKALLQRLADADLLADPDSEIPNLRAIDRQLFVRMGRFEYNFKALAIAMAVLYKKNLSPEEAIEVALFYSEKDSLPCPLKNLADGAFEVFQQKLTDIPNLYADAARALETLFQVKGQGYPLITVLLSEGNVARIETILHKLSIDQVPLKTFFDEVIIRSVKSREIFEAAKRQGLQHFSKSFPSTEDQFISVGDSLKRDIKFGNQAGFLTIYKPANFMGIEEPTDKDEEPTFKIQSLDELPHIPPFEVSH